MRVALVEHRRAEHTQTVWHVGQLVAGAPARKPQAMNQLELVVPQQVQHESAGVEHQVVTVVELVNVDGHARDGGDDRGPHCAVRNHAVPLAVSLRRDRHHWRGKVAEQLIDGVGRDRHGPNYTTG